MRRLAVRLCPLVLAVGALVVADTSTPSANAGGDVTCGGRAATIVGTARTDRLTGTEGDDVIVGLGGDDVLRGGGGDDVLCGGRGADKLVGGDGADELRGGLSRVSRGDETVYYRDQLVGGAGDDVLVPGYDGHSHDSRWDLLDFSDAPGPIVADVGADTVTGDGDDVVIGDHYAVFGSRYDDTLIGDDGEDELYGWDGADELRGGAGDDELRDSGTYPRAGTAPADDVLDGGAGADLLYVEDGRDQVHGRGGDDDIYSFSDAGTRLWAGPGDDRLDAVLVLADDTQVVDAGRGDDEVSVLAAYVVDGTRVYPRTVIDLAAGTAQVPAYDLAIRFSGADSLQSYLPALTWSGTEGRDTLDAEVALDPHSARLVADGRGGNDRIAGTQHADRIDGGAGWDRADGQGGVDTCIGVEVERRC
ncbi:calcium-binding protein [Nocardioides sp. MH1]|uniref:calcium-binding protein n=1 Tax=Nocardioides sp. MH1 TaxID=3242490 RepID=UPI003521DFC8